MEILFAGQTIADATLLKPGSGWDLVGTVVVDPGMVWKATNAAPSARGNRMVRISGSTSRQFATHADAVTWWATHGGTLPTSGTLQFQVGGVTLASSQAVLEQIHIARPQGVSVQADYTFLCAPPA